jgi:hypothetical protein
MEGKIMNEVKQAEFNEFYGWICEDRNRFEVYEKRFFLNLYMQKPNGKGLSAEEIIKKYHISHGRLKSIVCSYGRSIWRNQHKGCKLAAKKKYAAWRDPESGYNKRFKRTEDEKNIKLNS